MRSLKPSEHDHQVVVVSWWASACHGYGLPEIALMAIPNAAKRSYALAAYLKAEGMRAGALDMLLAVPHKGFGGLWLENKVKPNKLTDSQIKMIDFLECGYAIKVCYNADEAIKAIKDYLQ